MSIIDLDYFRGYVKVKVFLVYPVLVLGLQPQAICISRVILFNFYNLLTFYNLLLLCVAKIRTALF